MFTDVDGDYMMKINPIIDRLGEDYNVVDLRTGQVYTLTDDCPCIKVNAVINITD